VKGDGKGIEGGELVDVVVDVGLSGELVKAFGAEWVRGMRAMGFVVPGGAKVGWCAERGLLKRRTGG